MHACWRLLWGAAVTVLLSVTSAAHASVRVDFPQRDRAVHVIASCGGGTLGPRTAGAPGRAAYDGALDHAWVIEQAGTGVRLRAALSRLYLALSGPANRRGLGTTARADEAGVWRVTSFGDGRFSFIGPDGRYLDLPRDSDLAGLSAGSPGCSGQFWIDQFPVFAPYLRTVHVRDGAPPGGDGGADAPFATIQEAVDRAVAGDRILVAPGAYRGNVVFGRNRRGTADAWIVLESAVTHGARIVGVGGDTPAITLDGAFIEAHGFDVVNPSTEPCIGGQGDDIRVVETFVHDCGGGGIAMHRGARYHIEGNVVARTSFQNRWQMSGISIFQARGHTRCPSGFCNVIRRNITYGNDNHVLNWENQGPTDGNGIIIDDFANLQLNSRAGDYPGWTLVEHNLAFGNGGSAVRVYFSDRVVVRNNTSYRNMLRQDGGAWRGEFMNTFSRETRFERNIAIADARADRRNTALFDTGDRMMDGRASDATWRENLVSAWPDASGPLMRVAEGRVIGTPFLPNLAPVLVAPALGPQGVFGVLGARGADGVLRAPPVAVGADDMLLPPLR